LRSPVISVLTATRNAASFISETIRSVQAQDFCDWEYIIVDDASTDATCEAIEKYASTDHRIRLLRRGHCGGPYVAANDALAVSRGRYLFRIDGDDLCPPYRFSRQLRFMERHPEYRASVSNWQAFRQDEWPHGDVVSLPSSPRVFRWYLLLRSASIHSSACFERAALEELGGYRALPLSQDYRMWCELTRRNWLGLIPEVLSYVRFHPGRSTNQCSGLQRRLALDVLRDHWRALTGEECAPDELDALWAVGYSLPFSVPCGLRMLHRWECHWQADRSLTSGEWQELRKLTELRSWKFLRANIGNQPRAALAKAFALALSQPRSLGIATQAFLDS
jgi:hypothetical protein